MKTFKTLLLLTLLAALIYACSETTDFYGDNSTDAQISSRSQPVWVTVPFKVEYTGEYLFAGFNPERCNAVNVVVEGPGTGTHVGNSIIHFDFCGLPAPDGTGDFLYGDPFPSDAYIVAANGDSLFVTISGRVIQGRGDDHPEYVTSYWRDTFHILGGTGKFLNATGIGVSDDYNSELDDNSHHDWDGTITMMKGKPN